MRGHAPPLPRDDTIHLAERPRGALEDHAVRCQLFFELRPAARLRKPAVVADRDLLAPLSRCPFRKLLEQGETGFVQRSKRPRRLGEPFERERRVFAERGCVNGFWLEGVVG